MVNTIARRRVRNQIPLLRDSPQPPFVDLLLEQLLLHATGIDDAGLTQIAGFPALRCLNLKQTAVTEAAVKALAAKLPKCMLYWNGEVIQGKESK